MTFKNDRRAVLGMWDPWEDLREHNAGKDYPVILRLSFGRVMAN